MKQEALGVDGVVREGFPGVEAFSPGPEGWEESCYLVSWGKRVYCLLLNSVE